jgi:membrane protease subunit (stomatin/prohibitin family)
MAMFDVVKHEGPNDVLVWKWPGDQISWGSVVIVNQTQEAIFYKNGQALDVLGPGKHQLETENIPLLKTFVNIPFGNRTPFPAEVYFVDKATLLDVKWGTPSRCRSWTRC